MVLIEDVLISDDLFESHFMCDLNKCRGACCWEGDFGAPLSAEEVTRMDQTYEETKYLLSRESRDRIENAGPFADYDDPPFKGTTLMPDGACAFLLTDAHGISRCAIEQAHAEGKCTFQKPVSCHLYPVRVVENEETGFIAMNYDRWDICAAACNLGERMRIPLFRFVKQGIIRRFGQAFFDQMEAYYIKYCAGGGQ